MHTNILKRKPTKINTIKMILKSDKSTFKFYIQHFIIHIFGLHDLKMFSFYTCVSSTRSFLCHQMYTELPTVNYSSSEQYNQF